MKDVDKLVDEVFDGGFDQFAKERKVEKKIDRILDSVELTVHSTLDGKIDVSHEDFPMGPGEYAGSGFDDSEYDSGPSKEDNPQKISNDINHVPNQKAGELLKSVRDELSEGMVWKMIAEMRKDEKYKSYFRSMLKKHGYNSPADIPEGKKKDFFNAVDAGWKAANEQFIRPSGGTKTYGGGIGIKGTTKRGGLGFTSGSSTKGGFGMIKGRPNEQDMEDDEELEEKCKK